MTTNTDTIPHIFKNMPSAADAIVETAAALNTLRRHIEAYKYDALFRMPDADAALADMRVALMTISSAFHEADSGKRESGLEHETD